MCYWSRSKEADSIPVSQSRTYMNQADTLAHVNPDIRSSNGDVARMAGLIQRAIYHQEQYEEHGEINDLNEAIELNREAISLCPPDHPARPVFLGSLVGHLSSRYNVLGEIHDINEAIVLCREGLSLHPPGHPDRLVFLQGLANRLITRYDCLGGVDDLDEAIILGREALSLCPLGHPHRSLSLNALTAYLFTRHNHLGGIDDLNEAIVMGREALSLRPPGHPDRSSCLSNLAACLSTRYNLAGGIGDLNEAIVLDEEALLLRPLGHPDRSKSLNNLAQHLCTRYSLLGVIDDLNEAIVLDREAQSLFPPGHPSRSKSLNSLALHLSTRYERLGGIDDLREAIGLNQEALSLLPDGHPDRSTSLSDLSHHLAIRYDLQGGIDDLNQAILLAREVLSLRPAGHPGRSKSLSKLANRLSSRYDLLGGIDDLNEAIIFDKEAISLCFPGNPDRPMFLNNLANHLFFRFNMLGGIDDLGEAIVLNREALSLRPPGHPDRSMSLNNLANDLSSRFKLLWGIDDLDEAIVLDREALSLCPPGHPARPASLNNLAHDLSSRYFLLHGIDDLNEAILLSREALSLRPSGQPERSLALNNLATHLFSRYEHFKGVDDLNEAIILDQEALLLRPTGHPDRSSSLNNLALHLSSRYTSLRSNDDLNEAIFLLQEALSLHPPGHPDRSELLDNLTVNLSIRYSLLEEAGDTDAAIKDRDERFKLYTELEHVSQTVSVSDLSVAKEWAHAAEKFNHTTVILAYETALRLLVENTASLPPLPQHLDLLTLLSSSLAVDAFSACLRNQSPMKAVEFLEQGRAVFWGQLTRLRSPLDDIIASGPQGEVLAKEYTRLTSLIRNTLNSSSPDQHDRVCHFNVELQKVVSKIRELPGHSRFLLPLLFPDLQRAAKDGPVIIMNASQYGCDALIVFSDKDPIHIPLEVTKEDVRKSTIRLRALTRDAKRMKMEEMEKEFGVFLRDLWDKIVCHIVNVLQGTCPRNSRIWWCPTAEFSLLPLHAAAPYRKGQKGLSDLYVPSYATTLTALTRARRGGISDSAGEKPRFIAIGQAAAKGATELLHVGTELDTIDELVDSRATFRRIEGEDSTVSAVVDELGKNDWVHFACHGIPNQKKPFESAFALRDGPFTIQHISQCDLHNPAFAYLSACHTTVGYQDSPDEAIHLASAMQFAGFRSVIGTMWAVDDSHTNKVISMFYKLMIGDDDRLDYTRAARALRMTMKKVEIPMDQRVLYIHIGA